jgi:hypothetical protein
MAILIVAAEIQYFTNRALPYYINFPPARVG